MPHATRLLLLLAALVPLAAQAQTFRPTDRATQVLVQQYARTTAVPDTRPRFRTDLAPFFHGVASGDPLPDGVILWTRVTPDDETAMPAPIDVRVRVATDVGLTDVVYDETVQTDADRDYTVKVDVRGLEAGTTYYYAFTALGQNSIVGRTRTAPTEAVERLRFAVVSCSNYPAGFFNAYARVAERADLDAVFHLGDYLYEYDGDTFGEGRPVEPDKEIVTLEDYRIRHSLYKLDPDLMAAHQQHPFITVWDDHESTNDSYRDGAENHQPGDEGDWTVRKANAKRAYFEWMPIRSPEADVQAVADANSRIYRKLSYGGLADVFMIDTRLEARVQPIQPKGDGLGSDIDTTLWASDRDLLGAEQMQWLIDGLTASEAR